MCMTLICECLCFAHREESTATIRGRSETSLTPSWLSQPVMDCSKYKYHVYVASYVCFSANVAAPVCSRPGPLLPFIHQVSVISFSQRSSVCLHFSLRRLSFTQTGAAQTPSPLLFPSLLFSSQRWYFQSLCSKAALCQRDGSETRPAGSNACTLYMRVMSQCKCVCVYSIYEEKRSERVAIPQGKNVLSCTECHCVRTMQHLHKKAPMNNWL